jgi:transcriptional regulator with XRE-family HTH domain
VDQEELAHRAGVSVRAIRDLEAGRVRRPHGQTIRMLTEALGLTDASAGNSSRSFAPVGEATGARQRRTASAGRASYRATSTTSPDGRT